MRGLDETSLANLPEPRSVGEIAALALALDREAERRFAAIARELRALGSPGVADLLEDLSGEHGTRARRFEAEATSGEGQGLAEGESAQLLPPILSEFDAAVCDLSSLTRYRVFAFAVDLAQQSFKLYSYLAAAADHRIREYAEHLAHEELLRAARLRALRRQAYHGERRQPNVFPAPRLVESLADLLAAALAIEDRLAQRLAAAGIDASSTRERVEGLRTTAQQAGTPSGPMTEAVVKFGESADNSVEARRPLLADCERAFTFYDAVASAPVNEAVMLLAQDLCRAALERIRQIRASSEVPDMSGRVDPVTDLNG